jgi:hypothetical protein
MSLTLANRPPAFRWFYFLGLGGLALLWLTYMIRPGMAEATGLTALVLGFMPSLGGSFGTPFFIALGFSEWKKRPEILRDWRAFALVNAFVMAMCVLIEYAHQIFGLGGFHAHDILASLAGVIAAMIFHTYIVKARKI